MGQRDGRGFQRRRCWRGTAASVEGRCQEAARSPTLMSEQPQYDAPGRKITWKQVGVVTDGKIVTAARPEDAKEFADAVVEAIKK